MAGSVSKQQNGLIGIHSSFSIDKTLEALRVALERRRMEIHAHVDHSAGAEAAGLRLRPTHLFMFGYAEAETPVMQRCQDFGIEFPQKIIVWEDQEGAIWLTYNDPMWLGQRHAAGAEIYPLLQALGTSLAGIVFEAGGLATAPSPLDA